jgi:hypothetical protein
LPVRALARLRRVIGPRLAEWIAGWQRRRARPTAARRASFLAAVRAADLGPVVAVDAPIDVIRIRGPAGSAAPPSVARVAAGVVVPVAQGAVTAIAAGPTVDAAIRAATTDLVLLLATDAEPLRPDWLARLVAAMDGPGVVAATATLIQGPRPGFLPPRTPVPELTVRGRGTTFGRGTGIPLPLPADAGEDPVGGPVALASPPTAVAAAELACLLVRRAALQAALAADVSTGRGAWEARPHDLDPYAAADLTLRLRAAGGRIVAVPGVPVSVTHDARLDAVRRAPGPPRATTLTCASRTRSSGAYAIAPFSFSTTRTTEAGSVTCRGGMPRPRTRRSIQKRPTSSGLRRSTT